MILESVKTRRSGFAFSDVRVEDDKLNQMFEAARLSASSMNIQPWRYIYARNGEPEFRLILSALAEGNQKWAKNASVLLLSVAQVEYTYQEKKYKNTYAWHDTGMANAHLMLQATELGLVTHSMGGFDHQKVSEIFNLPNEYQPVAVIAIGYKGDETSLPKELLERQNAPRNRKNIEEFVFKGKFLNK